MRIAINAGLLALGLLWTAGSVIAHTLNGTVVDAATSKPIPSASVAVDVLIPDSVSFYATSGGSGEYFVSNLPPDNAMYVIRCYVPGYAPLYMRYDALGVGDRQVDLLMHPTENSPPGGGNDSANVSGIVLYELPGGGRNPINQAAVTLTSGSMQSLAQTGTDGRYSVRVRRASYALLVSASGFQNLTASALGVDSSGLTLNVLLKSTAVSVPPSSGPAPTSYVLGNAFPNPFNPSTTITYAVPVASRVSIKVYNLLGGEVATIVEGVVSAGYHTARFNALTLPSGVYVYRLNGRPLEPVQIGPVVQTRKMILVR
jgi:Carboxypeptidase regulatory-like domain